MKSARAWMAMAALLLGACGGSGVAATSDAATAESFIGERLPDRATNIQAAGERGVDTLVLLRFDAPADQASLWAERLLGAPLQAGYDPQIAQLGAGTDWWLSEVPPGASGGRATRVEDNRTFRVVVVPGQGTGATVWLAAFSS